MALATYRSTWKGSEDIATFIGTLIGLGIIAVFVLMALAGIFMIVMFFAAIVMSIIAGLSKSSKETS